MVESQAPRNRQSEKLWDGFAGSFHKARSCLTHRTGLRAYRCMSSVWEEACFGFSWRLPFVQGGLDGQWRHCLPCHLSSFKRVEYFSLRPRLAHTTSSLKFSARLGCFSCRIPPPVSLPTPSLPAFGQISGDFGICLWDCIYSFLMWWMQRYAFSWVKFTSTFSSLTGTKSHKYFLRGEKGFQMQGSKCEVFCVLFFFFFWHF